MKKSAPAATPTPTPAFAPGERALWPDAALVAALVAVVGEDVLVVVDSGNVEERDWVAVVDAFPEDAKGTSQLSTLKD